MRFCDKSLGGNVLLGAQRLGGSLTSLPPPWSLNSMALLSALLNQLERVSLLILDDFGLAPMDQNTRLALLQILEDRYAKKSIIIAFQLPIGKWHESWKLKEQSRKFTSLFTLNFLTTDL